MNSSFVFTETPLHGSFVITPKPFEDKRGWFFRNYSEDAFAEAGLNVKWLQHNHSFTKTKGSIRGMHFQFPPHDEIKIIRCVAGAVLDVIVDIRQGSGTFLQYFAIELNSDNKKILYIPNGFAHGFQTLTDNSELLYQHSRNYHPGSEGGLFYKDPALNIIWPLTETVISERDRNHSLINDSFVGINFIN